MLNTGFSDWPAYTKEEADAVSKVLLSNRVNYWTGNEIKQFENEFASWVGVKYAIALANGTVALDLALNAFGIGAGDEVIVTSRTFIASVSCIVNAGAIPVFADVDENSQNITADSIQAVLTAKTKAIICVHLAGWPCDMDPIMSLAEKNRLWVIEDCAQAHGALYKKRSVGSIGHVGAWSFCQDKIITTGGEGGMVTTNDPILWSRMWSYKDHGKSFETLSEEKFDLPFRWLHKNFGTNWRMTELQAVLGRIQLTRMSEWHKIRLENAEKIWGVAAKLPGLRVPVLPSEIEHAAYKCYVFLVIEQLKSDWTYVRILEEINARGVPCYYGSCSEVYQEEAFENTGFRPEIRLPVAKKLGETSLMFLVHPTLKSEEIAKTCRVLTEVMALATREASYDTVINQVNRMQCEDVS